MNNTLQINASLLFIFAALGSAAPIQPVKEADDLKKQTEETKPGQERKSVSITYTPIINSLYCSSQYFVKFFLFNRIFLLLMDTKEQDYVIRFGEWMLNDFVTR